MTLYKLIVKNSKAVLKTINAAYLYLSGIKDVAGTGDIANNVVDWTIQHKTKTTAQWTADTTTILLLGQIGVENTGTNQFKFKIGNGVDLWSVLDYAGGASGGGVWGTITGTLSDQTDLQTALDTKVDENATITGATKTKITYDGKGLVTSGADATTADISDSLNARYVTDAQLIVIGNTSGTNTGDNATNTTSNSYADGKVADAINDGTTTIAPSQNAVYDALALKSNGFNMNIGMFGQFSPNDSTTYYYANNTTPSTTTKDRAILIGNDCTIKNVVIGCTVNTAAGSGENNTFKIRVRNGGVNGAITDTTITTNFSITATYQSVLYENFNISVSKGSSIEMIWVTPIYATNPTNIIIQTTLFLV